MVMRLLKRINPYTVMDILMVVLLATLAFNACMQNQLLILERNQSERLETITAGNKVALDHIEENQTRLDIILSRIENGAKKTEP